MREDILRSLLLIDSDPAERRLFAATASARRLEPGQCRGRRSDRLAQGPHGREVRAALLSGWDAENGPA